MTEMYAGSYGLEDSMKRDDAPTTEVSRTQRRGSGLLDTTRPGAPSTEPISGT